MKKLTPAKRREIAWLAKNELPRKNIDKIARGLLEGVLTEIAEDGGNPALWLSQNAATAARSTYGSRGRDLSASGRGTDDGGVSAASEAHGEGHLSG